MTFKVTEKNYKSAIITCTTLRNDDVSSTASKYRLHEKKEKRQFISPLLWPPNSSDLNPVDYSVWSILQEKVYKTRITVSTTSNIISEPSGSSWITPSLLQLCVSGVVVFQLVSGAGGGHFEHCF